MEGFKPLIGKVATGASLTRAEAQDAFDMMLSGEVTPSQMGAFLMALRVRGESVEEITGALTAMRAKMLTVKAPPDAIDIVGTGGDGAGSYNVSTLAAILTAACGVPVAKHGNRAASSKSGASDVLTALGVSVGISSAAVEACIAGAGIGFMMAQTHHAAMRHVGPVRAELGARTIFNILGPLSNPANVSYQLVGVFSKSWLLPMAESLRNLGTRRAWLVHGSDGLDEMTTTGPTHVVELSEGKIRSFDATPEEAGLQQATPADLRGGDPQDNARALRSVLAGERGAYRDIAVLNAAGALVVAGRALDLAEGARAAEEAIESGRARTVLDRLVDISKIG